MTDKVTRLKNGISCVKSFYKDLKCEFKTKTAKLVVLEYVYWRSKIRTLKIYTFYHFSDSSFGENPLIPHYLQRECLNHLPRKQLLFKRIKMVGSEHGLKKQKKMFLK